MSTGLRFKLLCVTALVGAALVGPSSATWPPLRLGLLSFGLFNALVSLPGTLLVRTSAVALTVGVLLIWPNGSALLTLAAWLVWPPAYMAAWALARDARTGPDDRASADPSGLPARLALAATIGAVAVGSLVYRWLFGHNLQQSAALFIGIPALMAVFVVMAVSPRSATGVACKAVSVGLLVSMVFLEEGILCVLMSAPLFFLVAIAIARTMQTLNERYGHSTLNSLVVLLAIVPLSLEGVTSLTTVDRNVEVNVSRVVAASLVEVDRAIFQPPRFDRALPLYLRAGFPMAVSTRIERRENATLWVIRVRGGEMRLNGMEPRAGDLVLTLEEARPGLIRWRVLSDGSHMTHFLLWREIVVESEPLTPRTTRVTWTLRYKRGLDPAWYFGPWERYAVRLAAGYLIDAVATP